MATKKKAKKKTSTKKTASASKKTTAKVKAKAKTKTKAKAKPKPAPKAKAKTKAKATTKAAAKVVEAPAAKAAVKAPAPAKKKGRGRRSRVCQETGCKNPATTGGFCRLCYIKNWREIVQERRMKAREKLSQFVENLSEKYGRDYMEVLEDTMGNEDTMKRRLHEFGFREEFESGEKNPFAANEVRDLIEGMEAED